MQKEDYTTQTAKTYLNTASCGLLSRQSVEVAGAFYEELLTDSSTAAERLRDTAIERIRSTVATFLNAPASDIALLPNFSWGLNGVVQSLKGIKRVLLYRHDYPSLLEPFRINDFDIIWMDAIGDFEVSLDEIKRLSLEQNVEVIAISHVQWLSGFKIDISSLADFCRSNNILLIADATQSLGALVTDIASIQPDVLIASNYKWMNAGFGTGVMYAAPGFMEQYRPVVGGHGSYMMQNNSWQYVPSVRSYEPGHLNLHGLLVLEQAIKEKQSIGISAIETHGMNLTRLLLERLEGLPFRVFGDFTTEHRCPIVVVKAEDGMAEALLAAGIVVTSRNGLIRISMHFYNTEADVLRIAGCLADFASVKR
jgi:selenocysteine lyase/cysteine desulfurase